MERRLSYGTSIHRACCTGRFGEIEHGGEVLEGWFTFDPLNVEHEGYGQMEFNEEDEDDFLWIPFPDWEIAESLGKALVKAHEDQA